MLNKKRKNEKSQVIETNKVIKEVNVSNTNLQDNNYLNSCYPTLTIAIPSSIIDNAQSKELRSYLVGQIARTCSIFNIDEIVIFHDSLNKGTYKDKLNFCLTNIQYLENPNYLRIDF